MRHEREPSLARSDSASSRNKHPDVRVGAVKRSSRRAGLGRTSLGVGTAGTVVALLAVAVVGPMSHTSQESVVLPDRTLRSEHVALPLLEVERSTLRTRSFRLLLTRF